MNAQDLASADAIRSLILEKLSISAAKGKEFARTDDASDEGHHAQAIDTTGKNTSLSMDYLREGITCGGYGQKDR